MHIKFLNRGKFLAAASTSEGVRIWPVGSDSTEPAGPPMQIEDPGEMVWCAELSPDGRQLATVSESGKIKIYSFPQCEHLVTMQSSERSLRKIVFDRQQRYLAVSCFSHPNRGQLWSLQKLRQKLGQYGLDW